MDIRITNILRERIEPGNDVGFKRAEDLKVIKFPGLEDGRLSGVSSV